MEILNVMFAQGHTYMQNIHPHHWSRAYIHSQFKLDVLLNNLCEYFNSQIFEARTQGIINMNEMIRIKLMTKFHKKKDAMKNCKTMHCPRIMKILERVK